MGFSNGISEPIETPAPEWDADDAYERSLMDEPLLEIPPRDLPGHASDCAYWVDEDCSCSMRYDIDARLDAHKDREMGL